MHKTSASQHIEEFRAQWAVMSFYERFEQVIALILGAIISVVIVISLWQLVQHLFVVVVIEAYSPLDYAVFQRIFGMILVLLIAMEFKHSIIRVALRRDQIIQVKTVVLIAVLALTRKLIVLDPEAEPADIAALAFAVLLLGVVYWLMRERDDKLPTTDSWETVGERAARESAREDSLSSREKPSREQKKV